MVPLQVSRLSKWLVDNSRPLQYKIACFHAGVVDCCTTTPYTTKDKLELLAAWREAHTNVELTWCPEVRMPRATPSDSAFSGPIYAARDVNSKATIRFQQFPSDLRDLEAKSWTLDLATNCEAFKCDYYQDLLVVLEV